MCVCLWLFIATVYAFHHNHDSYTGDSMICMSGASETGFYVGGSNIKLTIILYIQDQEQFITSCLS